MQIAHLEKQNELLQRELRHRSESFALNLLDGDKLHPSYQSIQHHQNEREALRGLLTQARAELRREAELRTRAERIAQQAQSDRVEAESQRELEMLNRLQWEEYGEGEHASLKEAQEEVIRLQNVYLRYKHTSISRNNLAGARVLVAIMGRWQSARARAGLMCWKKAWNLDRLLHQKLSQQGSGIAMLQHQIRRISKGKLSAGLHMWRNQTKLAVRKALGMQAMRGTIQRLRMKEVFHMVVMWRERMAEEAKDRQREHQEWLRANHRHQKQSSSVHMIKRSLSIQRIKGLQYRLSMWRARSINARAEEYELMLSDLRGVLESERALRSMIERDLARDIQLERDLRAHVENSLREELGEEKKLRQHIEAWANEEGRDRTETYTLVSDMRAVIRREREGRAEAEVCLQAERDARREVESQLREVVAEMRAEVSRQGQGEAHLAVSQEQLQLQQEAPNGKPGAMVKRLMTDLQERHRQLLEVYHDEKAKVAFLSGKVDYELKMIGQLEADRLKALQSKRLIQGAISDVRQPKSLSPERRAEELANTLYPSLS